VKFFGLRREQFLCSAEGSDEMQPSIADSKEAAKQ
jgi:hypothetical protein